MTDSLNLKALNDELTENGIEFIGTERKWNTEEDVAEVVNALNSTDPVHYLTLDGNTLGVDAAAAIGEALKRHREFKKALWRNMFTGRLKEEIPIALQHLSDGLIFAQARLTVLDLSDNALGPNGMKGLEELLRSPVCYTLQELRLNNCGLGIGGGNMLSEALIACHEESTRYRTPLSLKVFIAGRNRLEDSGACAIANIFSTLKSLEIIEVPQNGINERGITVLAESFKQNPQLLALNLNDNNIGSKGAKALALAFQHTPTLRELNFGDCLLKSLGAIHLARVFQVMDPTLQEINFGFNEINSEAGEEFVIALQNQTALCKLNLDGNLFGKDGCDKIRDIMSNGPCPSALETLDEDEGDGDESDEGESYEDDDNSDDTEDVGDSDFAEYEEDEGEIAYVTTNNVSRITWTSPDTKSNSSAGNVTIISNTDNIEDSATKFCLNQKPCTLELLRSIKGNKIEALQKIINKFTGDNHLLLLNFTALKCAHLASESEKDILPIAIEFYKRSVDYAVAHKQEHRVLDFYLIHLGLLAPGPKLKFSPIFNVDYCRNALREALKNEKIASEMMVSYFEAFLDMCAT